MADASDIFAQVRWFAPAIHTLSFMLGAIVGSFLNVVIARLPAGESVVRPRSKCPKCGSMIPAWLNVPILSWIVLRGRCASCRTPISIRYPIVELLTACLWLASVVQFGLTPRAGAAILLATGLVVITFIDLDIWEIPDEVSLPGTLIGVVLRPLVFEVAWWDGLLGAAIGAFFLWFIRWFYWQVRKVEGMGLGDVKLIAMIGAFLGPGGLIPTILVASFTGSIVGAFALMFAKKNPPPATPNPTESDVAITTSIEEPAPAPLNPEGESGLDPEEEEWVPPANALPFGPFLALGALTQLFFGPMLRGLVGWLD